MAVCAFSMQRSEDIYIQIASKYNPSELEALSIALGALVQDHSKDTEREWQDYLGNYFEDSGRSSAKMGQFFTPVFLCNLMAEITADDECTGERQTVSDPSCGSSRNLIAHARKNPNNRFQFYYVGQDLDRRCCLMSVLNYVMFGMSGVVIHMNCISLEIYGGWRIWMPETMLGVQPLSVEECKNYICTSYSEPKKEPIALIQEQEFKQQLTLF
jgi:type I restriction enzyme M protein